MQLSSRRTRALVVAACVSVGLVGGQSLASSPPRAASSYAGCGVEASPGTSTMTVRSQGHAYDVLVHVPTAYNAAKPVALVFNLHGSTSDGATEEKTTGMDETADRHGFVVTYPNGGVPTTPVGALPLPTGYFWNIPGVPLVGGVPVPPGTRDDVRFLLDVVATLSGKLCIDPARIYATGASGGGRMASLLACVESRRFAAIAPVMGVRAGNPDKDDPSRPDPSTCLPSRPVPVLAIHGQQDPVDPYDGGGEEYWGYSVPTAMKRWAVLDGCHVGPRSMRMTPTVTRIAWSRCQGRASVVLVRSSIGGHEWPGRPAPTGLGPVLGPVDMSISADEVIWRFFAAHPLP